MPTLRPSYLLTGLPEVARGLYKLGGASGHVVEVIGDVASDNFVTGSTGWIIKGDGTVEFNTGTFRGDLIAGSLHIPDVDTTTNSVHIADNLGDGAVVIWAGATQTNKATAPFRVDADGDVVCERLTITGGAGNGNIIDTANFDVTDTGVVTAAALSITGGAGGGNIIDTANFDVTNTGVVTAASINITGGSGNVIRLNGGAFNVTSAGRLTCSNVTLTGSTGNIIDTTNFDVTSTGAVTASSLTMTGGSLSIGTGNAILKVNSTGDLWIGNATQNSAPFNVDNDGTVRMGGTSTGDRLVVENDGVLQFYDGATKTMTIDGHLGLGSVPFITTSNTRDLIVQTSGTGTTLYLQANGADGVVEIKGGDNGTPVGVLGKFQQGGANGSGQFRLEHVGQSGTFDSWAECGFIIDQTKTGTTYYTAMSMRDEQRGYATIERLPTSASSANRLLVRTSNDGAYATHYADHVDQSSMRWKSNTRPVRDNVFSQPGRRRNVLHDIVPIVFEMNNRETVGFSAEEFAAAYPEAVEYAIPEPNDRAPGEDETTFVPHGFKSNAPAAVLWSLVADLDNEFETRIAALEAAVGL